MCRFSRKKNYVSTCWNCVLNRKVVSRTNWFNYTGCPARGVGVSSLGKFESQMSYEHGSPNASLPRCKFF